MSIDKIIEKNPGKIIKTIKDESFSAYGKVLNEKYFNKIHKYLEDNTKIPTEKNIYVAEDEVITEKEKNNELIKNIFGQMLFQIGYCHGNNDSLNGLEYHKCSEVIYAVTDIVLILGKWEDIKNNEYLSSKTEIFYVEKGTALELYPRVLHFSPAKISIEGFKTAIILEKGTNTPLEKDKSILIQEDKLLFAKNKWLILHEDKQDMIDKGGFKGIEGENIKINI
ncbi:DUF4867 family protein [Clostridium grantii]|uniref:DUF4867 domain-containing protein n=1 Tax=Clostridium grantii DSM 8605 TaxID=1121316 RepID=A0A1M5W647_9CLOT|nr:DUF4867 family protein [Clostridium grantii]SHH82947.1 protein of unknown function [Clostridium grantii DSM 8605]